MNESALVGGGIHALAFIGTVVMLAALGVAGKIVWYLVRR
jgi:hypothetical protein